MILRNGKRLDGCSDTVPIGTMNPYIGTTAPFGSLLCQGQYVSKIIYPELYAICGSTFGPETETEFKLPDLRGVTIAGYKEGDSTFGTLGGLIGSITKSYTPEGINSGGSVGNHTYTPQGTNTGTSVTLNAIELTHSGGAVQSHTLTINEMPSHTHTMAARDGDTSTYSGWTPNSGAVNVTNKSGYNNSFTGGGQGHTHGFTQPSKHSFTPITKSITQPTFTGTAATLSHTVTQPTFTGTAKDINVVQPTITLNWIVKAIMLIPNQSTVVNSAVSSTTNVYSTNYINDNFYTKEEIINLLSQYLPLPGGTITGNINVTGKYQINSTPVLWDEEE